MPSATATTTTPTATTVRLPAMSFAFAVPIATSILILAGRLGFPGCRACALDIDRNHDDALQALPSFGENLVAKIGPRYPQLFARMNGCFGCTATTKLSTRHRNLDPG